MIHTVLNANFCSTKFGKHWLQQSKISWKNMALWIFQVYFEYPGGTSCRAAHVELGHRSPIRSSIQCVKGTAVLQNPVSEGWLLRDIPVVFDPVRSVQKEHYQVTWRGKDDLLSPKSKSRFPAFLSLMHFKVVSHTCVYREPWLQDGIAGFWGRWGIFKRRAVTLSQQMA